MPTVLTLDKSLSILEAIVSSPDGIGTRALAKDSGLNVATVHNIAMTFVHRGYLRQDEHTRHFHAGLRLHLLGRAPACRLPLVSAARRIVQKLSSDLNESVMLGALEGSHRVVNLAFAASRQALRVHEPEDMGAYAHCTAVGKILLAYLKPARLDTFLSEHPLDRHTKSTITNRAALDRELEQTRARSYAQTRDELCEGSSAYAVPIRDPWGAVFAAIGASAPTVRMKNPEVIHATLSGLRLAASELETILSLNRSARSSS
jgi:DNA-binding IclR family transcriptional regulator